MLFIRKSSVAFGELRTVQKTFFTPHIKYRQNTKDVHSVLYVCGFPHLVVVNINGAEQIFGSSSELQQEAMRSALDVVAHLHAPLQ